MKHYVYKTTNKINNKIYIGVHESENIETDSYLGSGYALKNAVNKYGEESFIREILFEYDTAKEAYDKEREIVNEEFIKRSDVYNIVLGGHGGNIVGQHTEESKRKMSEFHTGKTLSEEHKKKIGEGVKRSESYYEYIKSEENSKRVSELRTGVPLSEETKLKISESKTGSHHTEESKQKMSESRKGVAKSEEHKEAIRNSHLGRTHDWQDKVNKNPEKIQKTAEKHRGMKRSEESKKRMSEARSGISPGEKHPNFNGYFHTPYGRFCAATTLAKQLGIGYWNIINRCKQNEKTITEKDLKIDNTLNETYIGKTWKDCGWWFEPVDKTNIQ